MVDELHDLDLKLTENQSVDVDQEEEIGSGPIQNREDYMLRCDIFTSAIAQKKLQE